MNKLLLLFLFAVSTLLVLGQKPDSDSQEVQQLKQQLKEADFNAKQLSTDLKNQKSELENKIGALDNKVDAIKNDFDLYIKILGFFGIGFTLIALYQIFINTKRLINKRIANIVEDNRTKIIQLIQSQDLENRIRKESKIIVLSATDSESLVIETLIKSFDFNNENIKYLTKPHYSAIEGKPDLLIFNGLEDTVVQEYLKNSTINDYFVAYTKANLGRHDRLNFSNSSITLYTQVMNTLKFRKIIIR